MFTFSSECKHLVTGCTIFFFLVLLFFLRSHFLFRMNKVFLLEMNGFDGGEFANTYMNFYDWTQSRKRTILPRLLTREMLKSIVRSMNRIEQKPRKSKYTSLLFGVGTEKRKRVNCSLFTKSDSGLAFRFSLPNGKIPSKGLIKF